MGTVHNIADGAQWAEVDPDVEDPTESERSQIDGMTEGERRIWWLGFNAGWADCKENEDRIVGEILTKTQAFLDSRIPRSRPQLVVAR